ncbi:unnamed protein product [Tilletia controversa]|nr:unnamed protein product [Tilletia controversa]
MLLAVLLFADAPRRSGLVSYGKSAFRRLTIFSDVHTLSGWLLAPFVLHHAYLNRIVPSSPQPPINALSPSELDYTYVTHAFGAAAGALTTASRSTSRSLLSSVSYAALIGLSLYHSSHGIRKILEWRARATGTGTGRGTGGASDRRASLSNTEARSGQVAEAGGIAKVSDTSRRRRPWDLAAIVATLVVGGGLTRLVLEADGQPPFLLRRYEACYSLVWPYTRTL